MKTVRSRLAMVTSLAVLGCGSLCEASPILAVNFQPSGTSAQSGFSAFTMVSGSSNTPGATQTYTGISGVSSGTLTVGVQEVTGTQIVTYSASPDNEFQSRYRGLGGTNNGTFTYSGLYSNFVFNYGSSPYTTTGNMTGMDIYVTGLDPNTSYSVDVYAYDGSYTATTYYFRDVTAEGVPSSSGSPSGASNTIPVYGSINTTGGTPTYNEEYGLTQTFTSDANGDIVIDEQGGSSNQPRIDGLTISAVPEPATLGLIWMGSGLLLARRRQRNL